MSNDASQSVLERLLGPIAGVSARRARAVAEMRADAVAQARIEELAKRCSEGQFTPEERREYETYVHAGNLIAILQAKAQLQVKLSGA